MTKAELIPAIMPKNLKDLADKVSLVKEKVETVQIDIMDGIFVPEYTWPFPDFKEEMEKIKKSGLPYWQEVNFELDLMVKNAASKIEDWILLDPSRIIFHIEAEDNLNVKKIKERVGDFIEIGLAINPQTPIENIELLLPEVDFVQCMGIARIGFQGEPFDERVFEHIDYVRTNYPYLTLAVDGGVNLKNAPDLIKAGIKRLVAGSAIFKSNNIPETIEKFYSIIKK